MGKKITTWKTKGMNRDLSVSAFSPEFAFENKNLRLSTNNNNTLLSWVNEKGTKRINLSANISGTPLGTAVLNHQLVLFTHTSDFDYIYILKYTDNENTTMSADELYKGHLKFNVKYPIETLTSYEADHIQKVYWVDGINQPRLINIAASAEKRQDWIDTSFDFLPSFASYNKFTVERNTLGGGLFAPGVIQYCFAYYNKHGQQTNIVGVSPLCYIVHQDRGASPEEKVSASFTITIEGVDEHFDYIRLYSIQRTSIDATPIVKIVDDIPISNVISYVDNGTLGSFIDPMELLYIGGKEIHALTIAEKDNTLFIGNFEQPNMNIDAIQSYFFKSKPIRFGCGYKTLNIKSSTNGTYDYTNFAFDKNQEDITTFKGGETYRFGIQLQKATGEWSSPIYLNDVKNEYYPAIDVDENQISLVSAWCQLTEEDLNVIGSTYVKVRPVVVYPTIGDRTVLCQGVLNPTVFNTQDRINNTPFSQASWFFRPYVHDYDDISTDRETGAAATFRHYESIYTTDEAAATDNPVNAARRIEIQGSTKEYESIHKSSGISNVHSNTQFFVDQSIITLNSPDIDFDTEVQSCATEDLRLKVVGVVPITATSSSHSIQTSSAMMELWHLNTEEYKDVHNTGTGELSYNIVHQNANKKAQGKRLVSEYLWNDAVVYVDEKTAKDSEKAAATSYTYNYLVYPWQRTGSLNTDSRSHDEASSMLRTKKEANLMYSEYTDYLPSIYGASTVDYAANVQMYLQENAYVQNIRLRKQQTQGKDINYYPNIDKVLYNTDGYDVLSDGDYPEIFNIPKAADPISMKYKSTSHAVIALKAEESSDVDIPILPSIRCNGTVLGEGKILDSSLTFWDTSVHNRQDEVDISASNNKCDVLLLGELYRVNVPKRFGGDTPSALAANNWLIGGEEKPLVLGRDNVLTIDWTIGDTFYQRYDCLKTYSFTKEDPNQLVEILSFMCETRVNIDGRYDRNRGQNDNTEMSPQNFNLLNPIYSQKNNFFTSKIISTDKQDKFVYPNLVYYTKTKNAGADIDMYTNVTLASLLELDGNKGALNKIANLSNQLIAFQDTGISQILYNESMQISSTEGTPIEIANSGKVQGKRYLSNINGCANKWSVVNTPRGAYFIDSYTKDIFLFNGQLNNLSTAKGFDMWSKTNIPSPDVVWSPEEFKNFVSYYDEINQEVYFINKDTTLAYSEKLDVFSSFYDYGYTPYFCNLNSTGVWIRKDGSLWKHQAGDYCKFFGTQQPFYMTLIGNPEPQLDKIFTNLEFRANVDGDGTVEGDDFTPYLPFNSLETWNEYQHGITTLSNRNGHSAFIHHSGNDSSLKRKFRIWRCDIPRDNASLALDEGLNIHRISTHPVDRMRNPWLYLKLMKNVSGSNLRTEIHDIQMTYFG